MTFTTVPPGYYRSAHWKKKRQEALAFWNYTCQRCGKYWGPRLGQSMLEVHHTQKAYQQLWQENVCDLPSLCGQRVPRVCHTKGTLNWGTISLDR